MTFRCVAFDLDDTLLDTRRLLVPQAARESAAAMVEAGLDADVMTALATRDALFRENPRAPLYERIVERLGARAGVDPARVVEAGRAAFLRRDVETSIEPIAHAAQTLEALKGRYKLYLVTSGDAGTQMRKIEILGLAERFDAIFTVDPARGERKGDAFARILRLTGARPEECLSVGNRVDTDVGEARALGWKACWVRHGEYVHLRPSNEIERPDFQIDRIEELIPACGL